MAPHHACCFGLADALFCCASFVPQTVYTSDDDHHRTIFMSRKTELRSIIVLVLVRLSLYIIIHPHGFVRCPESVFYPWCLPPPVEFRNKAAFVTYCSCRTIAVLKLQQQVLLPWARTTLVVLLWYVLLFIVPCIILE